MEPINKIPNSISGWLHDRGLTDDVINQFLLWSDNELVIPVLDEYANLLFNKYRRSPFSTEGPKYRYEKGSTVALYNLHTISGNTNPIFICEGELDCLLLNSKGLTSVTSTGGSGTFKKEWAEFFEGRDVYIVFDKDEAGYKGAMKVQSILPFAKIIILPDDMEGNDITDYFQNHTIQDFFAIEARSYPIPREPSGIPTEKKDLKALVKSFGNAADELIQIKRDFSLHRKSIRHILIYLDYVNTRYETFNHTLKSFDRRYNGEKGDNSDIIKAKSVPITQFIKFSYDGFAKCIWHTEKSGSMKYNKPGTKYPNTVKCFGCGAMGDTVDVVMHMQNVDFGEAIKIILNKNV